MILHRIWSEANLLFTDLFIILHIVIFKLPKLKRGNFRTIVGLIGDLRTNYPGCINHFVNFFFEISILLPGSGRLRPTNFKASKSKDLETFLF